MGVADPSFKEAVSEMPCSLKTRVVGCAASVGRNAR